MLRLAQSQGLDIGGTLDELNGASALRAGSDALGSSSLTQNGGGTFQLGVSIAGKLFGIDGTLTLGIAVDTGGDLAGYAEYGAGIATSPDFALGIVGHGSNATTVQDLAGPFVNVSSGGGWGAHATGDGFTSTTSPIVTGGGFTVGTGAGGASSVTYTNTVVTPSINALRAFFNWACTWAICGF
jgi:hypothetical protein